MVFLQPSVIPPEMGGAKLNRAREHFNDLRETARRFTEEYQQSAIRFERDTETGDGLLEFLHIDPPITLSMILGDCIEDLRSALDHSVYELARRRKGDDWGGLGRSEFPIFADRELYGHKGSSKISGVAEIQRAFIQTIQPYNRGHGKMAMLLDPIREGLGILHELSRIDKHR